MSNKKEYRYEVLYCYCNMHPLVGIAKYKSGEFKEKKDAKEILNSLIPKGLKKVNKDDYGEYNKLIEANVYKKTGYVVAGRFMCNDAEEMNVKQRVYFVEDD